MVYSCIIFWSGGGAYTGAIAVLDMSLDSAGFGFWPYMTWHGRRAYAA